MRERETGLFETYVHALSGSFLGDQSQAVVSLLCPEVTMHTVGAEAVVAFGKHFCVHGIGPIV